MATFGSVYTKSGIYRKWEASDHFERLGRLPSKPLEKYEEGHTRLDIEFLAKLSALYAPLCTYKLRIRNRIVFFTRDELMVLLKYYYVKNIEQDEYGQFYFISDTDRRHNERTYLFKPFRTTGRFIYHGILMNDSSLSNIRFVLADPNDLFTVTFDELRLLVTFDAVNELCLVNDMILLYYTNSYGHLMNISPLVEVYLSGKARIYNGYIYTVNPYTGTLIPSGKFCKDIAYFMEEAPGNILLDSSVFTSAFFKEMKDRKIYVKNTPVEMASFLIRNSHSTQRDFSAHKEQERLELFVSLRHQREAAGKKPYKQLSF